MVTKRLPICLRERDADGISTAVGIIGCVSPVPAKDFWPIVLYDPQTRCELQCSQPFPSKNNKRDNLNTNADGSVTCTSVRTRRCRTRKITRPSSNSRKHVEKRLGR